MDDYYKILELDKTCTKEEVKKKYHKMSLKYHPDKPNGDNDMFLKVHEAYETLYDDDKRKLYNLKLLFKDIDLTEDDYNMMFSYYNRFVESKEYKLLSLLYKSLPKSFKEDIIRKFKYRNSQIVKAEKSIDITGLFTDEPINLIIKKEDYENDVLKIIYIYSNSGIYYLYLRRAPNLLVLKNGDNTLKIKFFYNLN